MDLKVVFKNAHFVALNKPSGVLTVPSRIGEQDSRLCLGSGLQKNLGAQVWPIHRLDYEVSGLVLFALSAESHRAASLWFEKRWVQKVYEAWTEGSFEEPKVFEWKNRLQRGKKRTFEAPHGKPSETRARLEGKRIWKEQEALQWSLEPKTGRSHQLRVHLSQNGYPILGDCLYGSQRSFQTENPEAIALRSRALLFDQHSELDSERKSWDLPSRLDVNGLCDMTH
jgi:tRNA pseudouridine32 synthase / 23S rRNA pseudouridine746 synthase